MMVIILFVEGERNMKSSKQKKHLKKGLVLILCLVLLFTTVFACGKDKKSNTEEEKEVVSDITGEDSGEGSGVDDEVKSDETQNDNEDVSDDTAQGNDGPIQDDDTAQGNDEPTQGEDESIQGDDEPIEDIPSQDEELVAEFPRMDGSTSAIPLEAGFRSELYDISYYEALSQVSHTTTHQSFDRLLYAKTDLIFSVPLSEEQMNKASSLGVTIEMEPVAKEGFVFVVNANNPVDTLTQDQIRKIYSGEITNWKEVGGNDAPILAYQRNEDSGSQNYMTEFMGDVPLMEPVTTTIPGGMAAMMDAVASYNNAENAIGYSVYSYAAQMYANQNEIKFIEIDGVKPSKATMADGTYPLLSCTYVMYKSNHSRADELAELVEWMTSEEGQKAVLACGYIPVMDMEIPDAYLPYEAVGTGIERPVDYKPSEYLSIYYTHAIGEDYVSKIQSEPYTFNTMEGQQYIPNEKLISYEITFLKDKTLEKEINDKIAKMITNLDEYARNHPEMFFYTLSAGYKYDKDVKLEIKNGYLSVLIGYPVNAEDLGYEYYFGYTGFEFYQYCETLCYDLIEGKELNTFSDLFYNGEEFVSLINNCLADNMPLFTAECDEFSELQKADFNGLYGDNHNTFTLSQIYFPEGNAYFRIPLVFDFTDYNMMDSCVIYRYRSMDDIFTDAVHENNLYNSYRKSKVDEYEYCIETIGDNRYTSVCGSRFHSEEEVKKKRDDYIFIQDEYYRIFDTFNYGALTIYDYENYYKIVVFFEGPYENPILFVHKDTLKPFTIDDFLKEGWKDYVLEHYGDDAERFVSDSACAKEDVMLIPDWDDYGYTRVCFGSDTRTDFKIPNEYLRENF